MVRGGGARRARPGRAGGGSAFIGGSVHRARSDFDTDGAGRDRGAVRRLTREAAARHPHPAAALLRRAGRLSRRGCRELIERPLAQRPFVFSAASLWEVAIKAEPQAAPTSRADVGAAAAGAWSTTAISEIAGDRGPRAAAVAGAAADPSSDPFDRMLVAQATGRGAYLRHRQSRRRSSDIPGLARPVSAGDRRNAALGLGAREPTRPTDPAAKSFGVARLRVELLGSARRPR